MAKIVMLDRGPFCFVNLFCFHLFIIWIHLILPCCPLVPQFSVIEPSSQASGRTQGVISPPTSLWFVPTLLTCSMALSCFAGDLKCKYLTCLASDQAGWY